MIAEPIDVRRLFGIQDDEKDDGSIAAALEYASKKLQQDTNKNWTGHYLREYIGTADGIVTEFTSGIYPIIDGTLKVATDDSEKITLELRDPADNSFTTVDDEDYSIVGNKGRVSFNSDAIPTEGMEIFATYYYDTFKVIFAEASLAAYFAFSSMSGGSTRAIEVYNEYVEAMKQNPFYLNLQPKNPPAPAPVR